MTRQPDELAGAGRPLVEFVCPEAISEVLLRVPFAGGPLLGKPLVGDIVGGDGAALVELPAGWRGDGSVSSPVELIVLEGVLRAGARELGRHGYLSAVPSDPLPPLAADGRCLVFVDAIADVVTTQVVPFDDEAWRPGRFPGRLIQIMRGADDTERGFFYRSPAGSNQLRTEWHDCAEAGLMLEGDLWHDRANGGAGGTMRRHCYFWRPAHVLHSPMGSDEGSLMWISVNGPLVNHYVDDEGEPPAGDGSQRTGA